MTTLELHPPARPRVTARAAPYRGRFRHVVAALGTVALLAVAWAIAAPPQVGGGTTYVITTGISMLPNFHAGDLVLLRTEPGYHVGEVAGYHNGRLGVTVMHRIVAVNSGHYVFKGDNNSWVDSVQPTAAQVVGAEWVHLSGWGNVLLALRAPGLTAVVFGLAWLGLFWPRSRSRRHRRRHGH